MVNLAPTGEDSFTLILSEVTVLDIVGEDKMENSVHGWVRPNIDVAVFLADYSTAGGTHHLVMVYGDVIEELKSFGKMMGFSLKVI